MNRKPLAQSRLRCLSRDQLEKLCIELAEDLRRYTSITDTDMERYVETPEEASQEGLQSLAMAMDPSKEARS